MSDSPYCASHGLGLSSNKWASAFHILPVGVLILETPKGINLDLILCQKSIVIVWISILTQMEITARPSLGQNIFAREPPAGVIPMCTTGSY